LLEAGGYDFNFGVLIIKLAYVIEAE
jgi:hypothetical protein